MSVSELIIRYPGLRIKQGEQIIKNQVINEPEILFNLKKDKYYTLLMIDADSPKPNFIHWLIINITTSSLGKTIFNYYGPNPPENTGYHKYIFLLFEHNKPLENIIIKERIGFNVKKFVKKYKLKTISINYFKSSY